MAGKKPKSPERQAIIDERQALELEVRRLETEIEVVRVRLEGLQDRCEHPKMFRRSVMGKEYENYCPDCGLQD